MNSSDRKPSSRSVSLGALNTRAFGDEPTARANLLGSIVGPYRLVSVIGRGGAGTVYLAERVDRQYLGQVAIKVVEDATLQEEIARRFRSERQILAGLNHPGIARLLDAGETQHGYPYLVMEYVQGEAIDAYCDSHRLNVEQRIALILKVCDAVRYAHQNLVVHRDLKPANILVTATGEPKLLDFGIAKLIDTRAMAAEMALTRMNDRVLTPEYASPEQITGAAITTGTDVYSLGMVIYELLVGIRPYRVNAASQLELERSICLTEAQAPSATVHQALRAAADTQGCDIHGIAAARRMTPMKLRAQMEGDIDAILLRALRKEPEHRYHSIDQLASDLAHFLAREPVVARQGNWAYYSRRFMRKHALGVSVAVSFVVLLAAGLIVTSMQARTLAAERDRVNRERQTSDAVATFMTDVFAAADPFVTQGQEVTARNLLDNATRNIDTAHATQPAIKARLLETMGMTYLGQGMIARGVELLEQSLQLRRQLGERGAELVPLLIQLSDAYREQGDWRRAKQSLQDALQLLQAENLGGTSEYADVQRRLNERNTRQKRST